ncbi:hypothetical protein JXL83_06905 [candidate division WOR-3 bacterium]|nr:hypothetical protein [candidate division WOR-3 bacterium]
MKKVFFLPFFLLSILSCQVFADEEANNRPVVRASQYGMTYAKSIPDAAYGDLGKTLIYSVGWENDELICEYNWYANEIYLGGPGETTIVRFGPWQRGREPSSNHLALGIYRDGRTLREYSTLEMTKLGCGISTSVSHYEIFGERLGFRWMSGDDYVFEVKGVSGKLFTFDVSTGDIKE